MRVQMPENAPDAGSSIFKSWVIPIVCVVGFAAGVAYLMQRFGDWPFPLAFVAVLAVFLGTAAYFLGMYSWYEAASKRLGWSCRTGPQVGADRTVIAADIVIQGEFRGRPFTLSREKSTSPGRRIVFSSSVEWEGDDLRVPVFSLQLRRALDVGLDRIVGSGAMVGAIVGAIGDRHGAPGVALDPAIKLARRAELSAPDAAAAAAFLAPMRCDALDSLVGAGSIHGEPGRIVLGGLGFPFPWQLAAFIAHAEDVRSALAG